MSCIESTRNPNSERPQAQLNGRTVPESHVVWEAVHGPLNGLWVLHTCDNPRCINIDHLFAGTVADNAADMVAKGRHRGQKRTHCPQGHEYTAENTYRAPGDNDRRCKECNRQRAAQARGAL